MGGFNIRIQDYIMPHFIPARSSGGLDDESVKQYIANTNRSPLYFAQPWNGAGMAVPIVPLPKKLKDTAGNLYDVSTTQVEPPEAFRPLFDIFNDYEHENSNPAYLTLSLCPSGNSAYYMAYGIDHCANAWMATGETQYLDRALLYIENYIGIATPNTTHPNSTRSDNFLGWPTAQALITFQVRYVNEYEQGEAQFARSSMRLLWFMSIVPSISNNSGYSSRSSAILQFISENIVTKWWTRGTVLNQQVDIDFYSRYAHFTMLIDLLSSNSGYKSLAQEIFVKTNGPTGYTPTSGVDTGVFRSVQSQFQPHIQDAGAYWWSDDFGNTDNTGLGEDVSHANLTVGLCTDAIWLGYGGWTENDLIKLRKTYDIIHDTPTGYVRQYLNGGNLTTLLMSDWVKLGQKYGAGDTASAATQIKMQATKPFSVSYRAAHFSQLMLNAATHHYSSGTGQAYNETVGSLMGALNMTASV